jgi:hypothetical protein
MSPIRLCGADTLVRDKPQAKTLRAMANAILAAIVRSFARSFTVFAAALQEIFDESAYQRFLDRTHLQSSSQAYAIFRKESEQAKSRRPRCC